MKGFKILSSTNFIFIIFQLNLMKRSWNQPHRGEEKQEGVVQCHCFGSAQIKQNQYLLGFCNIGFAAVPPHS